MNVYNVKSTVFELDWDRASPSALGNRGKVGHQDWRQGQGKIAQACYPSIVGRRTDSWVCLSYVMRLFPENGWERWNAGQKVLA